MLQMEMPLVAEPEQILTTAEVAKLLGVTIGSISHWIKEGYFPNAFRVNPRSRSYWRIPKSDVDAFIELRTRQRGYFYIPPQPPETE